MFSVRARGVYSLRLENGFSQWLRCFHNSEPRKAERTNVYMGFQRFSADQMSYIADLSNLMYSKGTSTYRNGTLYAPCEKKERTSRNSTPTLLLSIAFIHSKAVLIKGLLAPLSKDPTFTTIIVDSLLPDVESQMTLW